jgi:hypothetical protein
MKITLYKRDKLGRSRKLVHEVDQAEIELVSGKLLFGALDDEVTIFAVKPGQLYCRDGRDRGGWLGHYVSSANLTVFPPPDEEI